MKPISVELTCASCKKTFNYKKKSQVVKSFCTTCARQRNADAKRRYQSKKSRYVEAKQDLHAKLNAIPDRIIDPTKLIDGLISGKY